MIKYVHTNIVSSDWRNLAEFYINVFDCRIKPPERKLSGKWLEKSTGVKNASLEGCHLLLPGYGENGPTIEIFQYKENKAKALPPQGNREGYGHIAFSVDSVKECLDKILEYGGQKLGEIVEKEFSHGILTFTYAADPEGNIVEIQTWS
ncbi:MAG: VOC family protein [Halanaerobiales bacterium]